VADSFRRSQAVGYIPDRLNEESKANDRAGILRYSEHLVQLLVPDRAGQEYIDSLSNRLAMAEEAARAGKGNLVPEAKVAQAYNDLMKQIGAPPSLASDATVVHRLRLFGLVSDPGPAFLSVHQNGANCNPGEAAFLLLSLYWNNGGPRAPPASNSTTVQPSGAGSERWMSSIMLRPSDPDASRSLLSYSARHRPRATAALFDAMAKTMGF